jgi:hypothetical protein
MFLPVPRATLSPLPPPDQAPASTAAAGLRAAAIMTAIATFATMIIPAAAVATRAVGIAASLTIPIKCYRRCRRPFFLSIYERAGRGGWGEGLGE